MDKARARGVARRLEDIGAVAPGMRERVADEVDAMTRGDYIPGGKRAASAANLRPAPAGLRCGARTGDDTQSGPIYCGAPATLMGDSEGGVACACARHEPILRRLATEAQGR